MKEQGFFLAKILGLSLALALFIRYVTPQLNLPATPAVALTLVMTPMLVMTGVLIWRWQIQQPSQE